MRLSGRPGGRGGEACGARNMQFMELDSSQRWSVLSGLELKYLTARRREVRLK